MLVRIIAVGSLTAFIFSAMPIVGNSLGFDGYSAHAAQKSKMASKSKKRN